MNILLRSNLHLNVFIFISFFCIIQSISLEEFSSNTNVGTEFVEMGRLKVNYGNAFKQIPEELEISSQSSSLKGSIKDKADDVDNYFFPKILLI